MEDSISMKELFGIIRKRWMLIALFTFVMGALSAVVSYFLLTPKYEASTQILVNQKDTNYQLDTTQMRGNIELINTYSVIIKSAAILEKVIEKLELNQTVEQLEQNISVSSQSESQVFSLTVQDSKPGRAVEIVNQISETFQQEIKGIMNVDNVNILAKAELKENPAPISPNPRMNIAVGIVLGLLMGVGLVFLLEYLDNSLHTASDVEAYLGLPVLGSIQKMSKQKVKKSSTIQKMGVEVIESQIKV
ncbi:YveK family protein [Robertmurraya andreesenii]|uniref:Capsular polysaccharide biosynthesis protein n=1 Tax=Anoxybacillus andreesenii TaxID=1325932 RepID=A0ABT9V335_9BACL|nr:Wzz/FepE/Etk N-terminal domain-containing protein [Robertmurraya andreesenii]MDQ0155360.1 capsular polysaccharide biosynthesis protein [Robertmurraya andreesenii]